MPSPARSSAPASVICRLCSDCRQLTITVSSGMLRQDSHIISCCGHHRFRELSRPALRYHGLQTYADTAPEKGIA
jgi:hypothetical protein